MMMPLCLKNCAEKSYMYKIHREQSIYIYNGKAMQLEPEKKYI